MTTAVPPPAPVRDREFLDAERIAVRVRLADEVRALIEAAVLTDVDEGEIEEVSGEIRALTERLKAARFAAAPMSGAPSRGPETRIGRQIGNAVTGVINPIAPPIPFDVSPDGTITSTFTLDEPYEGPPGLVHGGISAAIFDQLLGMAASMTRPAFTASLELRYRRPTPLRVPLGIEVGITRREGRKSWAEGRITTPDGTVTVEATALFITPRQFMPEEEQDEG